MTLKKCSHHIQLPRFPLYVKRQSTAYRLVTFFMFLVSFAVVRLAIVTHQAAAQSQQHSWVGDVPIMADLSVGPLACSIAKCRIVIFALARRSRYCWVLQ